MQNTFSPRRLNTPAARHRRAVTKRHVPYKKTAVKAETAEKTLEIPFELDHSETVMKETDQQIKEESGTDEAVILSEEKAPVKKKLTRKEKKAIRKQAKQDELDLMARQPYSTLFQMIIDPFGSVKRSVSNHFVEYSLIGCMIANLLKWILIGAIPAHYIAQKINAHAFSYALVSFSRMSKIAFEIGVLGFICEFIIMWMLSQSSRISKNSITFAKMYDTHTHGTAILITDALIGLAVINHYGMLHIPVTFVILVLNILLDIFMLYSFQNRKFTRLFFVYLALCAACVFVAVAYGDFLEMDLSEILMLIK